MDRQRRFLNVGGNSKAIQVPSHYKDWEHLLLDIDPTGKPDIVCDAREMTTLEPGQFDAIYCSHNLEHFFEHDVPKVLGGFMHILRDDGFAEIRVPNIQELMRVATERGLDIEDKLYDSSAGPIRIRDVLYGFAPQIAQSGVDFYAHKTGFSPASLKRALARAGFEASMMLRPRGYEIAIVAFRKPPSPEIVALLTPAALAPAG